MQLLLSFIVLLTLTATNVATAHMCFDNPAVWGLESQGASLENPLNWQNGNSWLHHGAKKDTNAVLELTPGSSPKLPIVCGEAVGKSARAGDICKNNRGEYITIYLPPCSISSIQTAI